ncbi:MAG: hypothetical protein HOP04_07670 [Methylophilaceae bacterium]|nr:hypothetical protein [Methylophilaceae bacterium]
MKTISSALALLLCTTGTAANAETIVNIQGFGDGISSGSGANIYSYPVAVGTSVSLQNPVLVDFSAGDYLLSDAWGQPGALYDTWNFQASAPGSWASHYVVATPGTNGNYNILLDAVSLLDTTCKNHFCAWDTQAQARDAFLATAPFHLHLDHATTLAFASADYYLPDNLGGISISVTAVPEPSLFVLYSLGLLGLGILRRKNPT